MQKKCGDEQETGSVGVILSTGIQACIKRSQYFNLSQSLASKSTKVEGSEIKPWLCHICPGNFCSIAGPPVVASFLLSSRLGPCFKQKERFICTAWTYRHCTAAPGTCPKSQQTASFVCLSEVFPGCPILSRAKPMAELLLSANLYWGSCELNAAIFQQLAPGHHMPPKPPHWCSLLHFLIKSSQAK